MIFPSEIVMCKWSSIRHEQYYCLAIDIDIFANDWYCHWYWKNFFRKIDIAIEIDKAVSKTIDIAIEIEKSQLVLIDKQLVLTLPSITIGIDIAIDFAFWNNWYWYCHWHWTRKTIGIEIAIDIDLGKKLETTTLFKCLSTFSVWKWLLSCVGPFVLLQTLAVFKCLNTCFAWKWFLSSVCPFMLLQISALLKCILKCDACQGPFTSGGTFVFLETTALFKCLSTFIVHANGFSPVWILLCFLKP